MQTFERRGLFLLALGAVALAATDLAAARPEVEAADATAIFFHARLERSVPAADDTLGAAIDSVRLEFSAAVSAELTRLVLVLPDADSILLEPVAAGGSLHLLAHVPPLAAGAHLLLWRTTSRDGHVLEGTIPFVVGAAAAAPEPAIDAAPVAPDPMHLPARSDAVPPDLRPLLAPLRALGTALLLALAGGLYFAGRSQAAADALRPLLMVAAIAAPLAVLAELAAWTIHVSGSLAATPALELATGRALLGRLVFAAAALAVLLALRSLRGAAVLAFVAVLAGGGLGHAGAVSPALSVPLRGVHMAASAVWLGGLLALGRALRSGPARRPLLEAVSAAALVSFFVVALTGAAQALLLLGSPAGLLTTDYGRIVLVKAVGLLLLAAFGYRHRQMIAALPEGAAGGLLGRSVAVETLVFLALIVVAAALAFAPLPE